MFQKMLSKYKDLLLNSPKRVLGAVLISVFFLALFIPQFRLDASSETLTLNNDQALDFYRQVKEEYGSDSYLVLTYDPKNDPLFSEQSLDQLSALKQDIKAIDHVASLTSILDVPLIESPPIPAGRLKEGMRTLRDKETNKNMAIEEILTHPIYRDLLVDDKGTITAVLLLLKENEVEQRLLKEREDLRKKKERVGLSSEEKERLEVVEKKYTKEKIKSQKKQRSAIEEIREKIKPYEANAEIHLGGVPMITVDSLNFVRKDLRTFGTAVLLFIIVLLGLIFRAWQWVLLPIITCGASAAAMIGFLGLVGWPVTVVSSNFISLMMIITLSLTVHLIVRYREVQGNQGHVSHKEKISLMIDKKLSPCFFTAVTTIVAFSSFMISGIKPVIDFGFMMSIGVAMAFIVAFSLFPALLLLMDEPKQSEQLDITGKITHFFSSFIEKNRSITLWAFLILFIVSVAGLVQLSVKNRFIDYYKDSTEIHQGMKVLDKKLGGTTPMDVILKAPDSFMYEYNQKVAEYKTEENKSAEFVPSAINGYWMTSLGLEEAEKAHEYLEQQEEIGKVLSVHSTAEVINHLQSAVPTLVAYVSAPDYAKDMLFDPYISEDGNELRLEARIYETNKDLERNELINRISSDLEGMLRGDGDRVKLSGMLVLYNNMLQSLFSSQILSLGFVFLAVFAMFILSFRSTKIALIAIVPNILCASLVLGIMGWFGVPLDIMTITIASVCIGIAVDDTIHYVHRFMKEYEASGDYWVAIKDAHDSIGRAMYYTSVTITFGFSILALSNFLPTIYFGLLTGLSMLVALLADLTLLPVMLAKFRPLDKKD